MTTAPVPPKPSRLPWIIVGVLGCLVVCLLVAVVGVVLVGSVGGFALFSAGTPTPAAQRRVTVTPVPFGFPSPTTSGPTAVSKASPVSDQPTPRATATTRSATATPAPGDVVGVPTSGPTAPTAAPAQPTATNTAPVPKDKIAYSVKTGEGPEDHTVWVMNADGTGAKKVLDRASEPTFSPDGKRIAYYHWTDGIYIANADGTNPQKIVADSNTGFIDWSHDGRLIAFSSQPGGQGNITINVVPPDPAALKDQNLRRLIAIGESPSWSPDDSMLVFHTCRGSTCGIFKGSSNGGDAIPVIGDDGGLPAWSPDGKKIVYQKDTDGQKQLFLINPDGTGKRQLTSGAALHVDADWSSDGQYLYYRSPEGGTWGIWRMNADGTNPVKLIDNVAPSSWPFERLAVSR